MPTTKNPNFISWRNSIPKRIILEDLIGGILPLEEHELSAEEAWEMCYQHMAEFVTAGVVFSQFEARLKDHRRQVKKDLMQSRKGEEAMKKDRLLFPREVK